MGVRPGVEVYVDNGRGGPLGLYTLPEGVRVTIRRAVVLPSAPAGRGELAVYEVAGWGLVVVRMRRYAAGRVVLHEGAPRPSWRDRLVGRVVDHSEDRDFAPAATVKAAA